LNSLKIVNSIASNDSLIISSGGISSKEDLIERLDNGANLVQVYTSFVYEGPSLVDKLLN
jgi:dihydroorotate dehydrogenase